eukprot:862899_1
MSTGPYHIDRRRHNGVTLSRQNNGMTRQNGTTARAQSLQHSRSARRPPSAKSATHKQAQQAPAIHIQPHQFQTFKIVHPLPQLEQDSPSKSSSTSCVTQNARSTSHTRTQNAPSTTSNNGTKPKPKPKANASRNTRNSSSNAQAMTIDVSDDLDAILGIDHPSNTQRIQPRANGSNHTNTPTASANSANTNSHQPISAPPKKKRKLSNANHKPSTNKTQQKKNKKRSKKANTNTNNNTTTFQHRLGKIATELRNLNSDYCALENQHQGCMRDNQNQGKTICDLNAKMKTLEDENARLKARVETHETSDRSYTEIINDLKEKLKREQMDKIRVMKENVEITEKYEKAKRVCLSAINIEPNHVMENVGRSVFNTNSSVVLNESNDEEMVRLAEKTDDRETELLECLDSSYSSVEAIHVNETQEKEIVSLKLIVEKGKKKRKKYKEKVAQLEERNKDLEFKMNNMEAGDWNGVIVKEYVEDGKTMYQMRWDDSFGLSKDDLTENDLKTWQKKKQAKKRKKRSSS